MWTIEDVISVVLLVVGALFVLPTVVFLCVKLGASAYFQARQRFSKEKETDDGIEQG